jgi:hypothetical protein
MGSALAITDIYNQCPHRALASDRGYILSDNGKLSIYRQYIADPLFFTPEN